MATPINYVWDINLANMQEPTPAELASGFDCGPPSRETFNWLINNFSGRLAEIGGIPGIRTIVRDALYVADISQTQNTIHILPVPQTDGLPFVVRPNLSNTGPMLLKIGSNPTVHLTDALNNALHANDVHPDEPILICRIDSHYRIMGHRIASTAQRGLVKLAPDPTDFSDNSNALTPNAVSRLIQRRDTDVFEAPGITNWVVPDRVNKVYVQVWGGGGGGGGGADANSGASGGGPGGYAAGWIGVTPSQVIQITVGAGGIGAPAGPGTSIVQGTAGGVSDFAAVLTAGGGFPGNSAFGNFAGVGGQSGLGYGGQLRRLGQAGGLPFGVLAENGINFIPCGGFGGAAFGSAGAAGPNVGAAGLPGIYPGGGGSGASAQGAGGTGANGLVIVEY